MISDDIGEIVSTSNRVLIMTAGKVVFEGNTAEVSAEQMNDMILRSV
jgi:ABC-type sugar transport system ATPase subunit